MAPSVMKMIAILLCAVRFYQPNASYAGLPNLTCSNEYRILTENVAVNLVSGDRVRVASTTVYRNIGAATTGQITVSDGALSTSSKFSKVIATWDDAPITFLVHNTPGKESTATATVSLAKNATHSLRMNVFGVLARTGYAKDQYEFRYKLAGGHKIDLFSFAYRCASGSVFGLPQVEPDLGWEVGPKGASIRKTDFTPGDVETKVRFYRNSLDDIGTTD